jgi:hypothetical protein
MTASFDSVSRLVIDGKAASAEERALAREVVAQMSAATIEEKGLLNHAQAALVLGVSVKRIGELVRLGKLTRFDFFERTYVSMREVCQRDDEELKSGIAMKSGKVKRFVSAVTAGLLETGPMRLKLGGYAGPLHEKQRLERIASTKEIEVGYTAHPKTVLEWVKAKILPVVRINKRCIRFNVEACAK